jgi:CubicO group peptidase (beta-lactamase class C family)
MGSIVVSQNGTLVYSKSVGKADVETNTKASPLTKYRIGSISKMFTSVLILRRSKKKTILKSNIGKLLPNN